MNPPVEQDRALLLRTDTVYAAIPVGQVLSSLEPGHPLLALARQPVRCTAGRQWEWDGVRFEMLRPPVDDYARSLKPNAMSCVLRVSAGGHSALLTGDIDQEAALVAGAGQALRSSVLVVPHHGSRTSSTAAFLEAVQPTVAVFQAGYRNRFGHPAPDVLERYRERGIAIIRSPTCGAWQWRSDAGPGGTCHRDTVRRYWHHDDS